MDIVQLPPQPATSLSIVNARRVKTDLLTSENIFIQTNHGSSSSVLCKSRSPTDNSRVSPNKASHQSRLSLRPPPQETRWRKRLKFVKTNSIGNLIAWCIFYPFPFSDLRISRPGEQDSWTDLEYRMCWTVPGRWTLKSHDRGDRPAWRRRRVPWTREKLRCFTPLTISWSANRPGTPWSRMSCISRSNYCGSDVSCRRWVEFSCFCFPFLFLTVCVVSLPLFPLISTPDWHRMKIFWRGYVWVLF